MLQLLFHAWGDYLFQSDWMARNKTSSTKKGYLSALIHSIVYALPFFFIASPYAVLVIWSTHFILDKYRLATHFMKLKNMTFNETGFKKDTPIELSTWLLIIVDNIIHISINYFAIMYL